MEQKIVSQHIMSCLDELKRLNADLNVMSSADIRPDTGAFEGLSRNAALQAEHLACKLRHLIYTDTTIKKTDYLADTAQIHGIKIYYRGGVLDITLPPLAHKRKRRQNTEFLHDPLYAAFAKYADTHNTPRFSESAVCFMSIYDHKLPSRRIRDYDNIEYKQILDVINSFILADDTGLLCDVFHSAAWGERDCTKVFVMERAGFPKWLSEKDF